MRWTTLFFTLVAVAIATPDQPEAGALTVRLCNPMKTKLSIQILNSHTKTTVSTILSLEISVATPYTASAGLHVPAMLVARTHATTNTVPTHSHPDRQFPRVRPKFLAFQKEREGITLLEMASKGINGLWTARNRRNVLVV
jgi:hypothetical protein